MMWPTFSCVIFPLRSVRDFTRLIFHAARRVNTKSSRCERNPSSGKKTFRQDELHATFPLSGTIRWYSWNFSCGKEGKKEREKKRRRGKKRANERVSRKQRDVSFNATTITTTIWLLWKKSVQEFDAHWFYIYIYSKSGIIIREISNI